MTSAYVRSKMDFRCGTRMSLSAVRKPHMKKRVVNIVSASLLVLGRVSRAAEGVAFAMAIEEQTPVWSYGELYLQLYL